MTGISKAALEVYADNGEAMAVRYDTVDAAALFAPLADLLPMPPAEMLDIGAGTGRDAAWFAARGDRVTAVEPTDSLRRIGMRQHDGFDWLSDTLPGLAGLAQRSFDLVLVNAVWHHLDAAERDTALRRLAELTRPGGRLLISLRQGPALPGRPVAATDAREEIRRAGTAGFDCLRDLAAPERGDAPGVTWRWLVLERRAE